MNEQLQVAITSLINKTLTGAEAAGEFLVGEIPDVVQQLLMWNIFDYGLYGLLWIITSIVLIIKCKEKINLDKKEGYDMFMPILFTGIAGAFFFLCGIYNFMISLKIIFAPKVWLIEYSANLMK